MGVSLSTFSRLAEFSSRYQTTGRSLMLGRQKFNMKGPFAKRRFQKVLDRDGLDLKAGDLVQKDGYAERMFDAFGFPNIECLDMSDYEFGDIGGGIIHDLNQPVPAEMHGTYSFIYDGGTLEHVFNVPVALENLFNLLEPGGRVFAVNPLNGWPTHGMYQFSPELVYAFWDRTCSCNVVNCAAISLAYGRYFRKIPNPQGTGKRVNLRSWKSPFRKAPPARLVLQYEVEKTVDSAIAGFSQQQDYVSQWNEV